MIYTSYDVFPHKNVPLQVTFNGSNCAKNILSVDKHFQAKSAKYSNFRIIKTTEAIPTKFCTTIKTFKCCSLVVPKCAPQIQDGRKKIKNHNNSVTV